MLISLFYSRFRVLSCVYYECMGYNEEVMNSDLLLWINHWAGKNTLLDGFGIFSATYLIYIVFAVAAACLGFCVYRREWKAVIYFCVALIASVVVLKIMGLMNIDHRPFMDHKLTQLIPHASGQSFPSDHTTASTAVALGVLFFTRFKKIGIALLLAACLIGVSRIFVGVHYPADIAGGLLTGLLGCSLVAVTKNIIESRRPKAVASASHEE